ncbi:helix-turn-helix domain-containing protein [Halomonas dongshanensis]|uniref:Helix-turn-helix domain-containing protein n=1 Tax=Halomonas dongshanensis TaxID=2890835 RepID=A0ABT2E8F0_9GAMM|nr:helix-turn-helix domain-containing protein [Halomonas dongshanensis]MCS2607838.1 helix-turn-helix domain-containing protein [Halomonas dongshanensis]
MKKAVAPEGSWLSTSQLPLAERHQFWRDCVNECLIDVDFPGDADHPIEASLRHTDLERVRLNQIRAQRHCVQRSQANIAKDSRHSVFLCFMLSGYGFSYQGTRCVQHAPGDIVIYDTRMPYGHGFAGDMEMLIVDLSVELAHHHLGAWPRKELLYLGRDTHMAADCKRLFGSLEPLLQVTYSQRARLECALALLKQLGTLAGRLYASDNQPVLWGQVERYVLQHLHDELTADDLARMLNISRRTLYRLFAAQGVSVQNYIWQQRLARCRKTLHSPHQVNRSISEIAFECGFNDAAHFSRRYKAYYGETPQQTRSALQNKAGYPPLEPPLR